MSKPIFITRTESAISGNVLDAIQEGDTVTVRGEKRSTSGEAFRRNDDGSWLLLNGRKTVTAHNGITKRVDGQDVAVPCNVVSVERAAEGEEIDS